MAADHAARIDIAVNALVRARPELSARGPVARWQRAALGLAAIVLAASASGMGGSLGRMLLEAVPLIVAVPFGFVAVLRIAALINARKEPDWGRQPPSVPDRVLPSYSVLVPLLREGAVVRQLVAGLARLAYPRDRLEILLIVEAFDGETRAAIAALRLASCMRVVVVPDGEPRTKPRALNYALQEARGELVTIFDAEDIPEPDQLLRAAAAFEAGSARLACLQARLNVYNPHESWLTRQFTLEYTALFDCILPLLHRWNLPVPLGGTSNHFRRAVLEDIGGWDPYNVPEDADLGIRLARGGWEVGVLGSTTWEEAPGEWAKWRNQRTRWLKGWIQTYLVHMREPLRVLRELGPGRFLGLQMLMGAMLVSALVHPWFYVVALIDAWRGTLLEAPAHGWGQAMLAVAGFNLVAGYLGAVALGAAALAKRGRPIGLWVLALPLYWLAISVAAYRAIWQLAAAPYRWEKTEHRGAAAAFEPGDQAGPMSPK